MKKHLLFSLCIAIGFSLNAQTAKEWLALSPVPLSLPALSHQKDVDNKTFTEKELFEYSLLNVNDLVPDAAKTERNFHQLRWEKAKMEQDTVIAPTTNGKFTLNYYAVYLDIPQWIEGSFQFRLFGNAEIYLDGQKKLTYTENQPANRSLSCELLPGKHSLIIKTVTKGGSTGLSLRQSDKKRGRLPGIHSFSQTGKKYLRYIKRQSHQQSRTVPLGKICHRQYKRKSGRKK